MSFITNLYNSEFLNGCKYEYFCLKTKYLIEIMNIYSLKMNKY
jgi:hypothetical protein